MDVHAFQCVYKSLKLIIEAFEEYLMMKKRDCFGTKQDSFLKVVFMHVRLWKITWQGYERFCHALGWFWQVLNVEEREKIGFEKSKHLPSMCEIKFSFYIVFFSCKLRFSLVNKVYDQSKGFVRSINTLLYLP